jgi:coenzyme F420-0:L-glutamate ligase/coenzyme F420-1:gamma-L-glutamate ligase
MMDTASDLQSLSVIPIRIEEDICPGDDIVGKLIRALTDRQANLMSGDILIVKHKIVSKAEGQFVELDRVQPSEASRAWAQRYGVDARTTEVALMHSKRIVRQERGVLITQTRHGFVCANSGVDVSNVDGGQRALLLPDDPDGSARRIQSEIERRLQLYVPVIITDTFGRPWREGLTEAAIGVAGMKAIHDYRGQSDPHGYPLRVSLEAVADELACAAGLVCGKLARVPACIIRGFPYQPASGSADDLIRPAANDLFQ